jgi:2-methylcitrate dehydratase PrpD
VQLFRKVVFAGLLCAASLGLRAEEHAAATDDTVAVSRQLAKFIVDTTESDIQPEYYEHAKVAFLDWLGVTLAGSADPLVRALVQYADSQGGIPQSSVLGYNVKKSVTQAALINGSASHALDFDDSHSVFRGHPSASIVAAVLALAEVEQKSGKEMLAAYLVGLDVGVTFGKISANDVYARGMHNTSALGVIAAAAASAHLLDLNEEQTLNALAIAATQAFGLKRSFGTMSKPLHAGLAAQAAVEAALLARIVFTGASDILEGPNGFVEVFGGSIDEGVLSEMGRDWGMTDLSIKYHASCHWTHGAIENILTIAERDGVVASDIKSIEITVSPVALKTAPIVHPQIGLEGKFSIPYSASNALVTGMTGMQGFTEDAVKNPEIAELVDKTTVVTKDFEDWFFTDMTITTNKGESYSASISVFENLPGFEDKRDGVIKKFNDLVEPILGSERTGKIESEILSLESLEDVSDLNPSEGMQLIREFVIEVSEKALSGYQPEVWD